MKPNSRLTVVIFEITSLYVYKNLASLTGPIPIYNLLQNVENKFRNKVKTERTEIKSFDFEKFIKKKKIKNIKRNEFE